MTCSIYAIGDVHGYMDSLELALNWVEDDGGPDARIIFVGDLVDRGPESRSVVETLKQGVAAGRNWTVLRGNHDRMFCRFLTDGQLHDPAVRSGISWLHPNLGGQATLASYGADITEMTPLPDAMEMARDAVPRDHIAFLSERPLYVETKDHLFVHAGVRPGVGLTSQVEDDLVWIREPFLSHPNPHPWLVVHGHTALKRPTHFGNRVDIDGGAGFGRPLVPVVFEGRDCWTLGAWGRVRMIAP